MNIDDIDKSEYDPLAYGDDPVLYEDDPLTIVEKLRVYLKDDKEDIENAIEEMELSSPLEARFIGMNSLDVTLTDIDIYMGLLNRLHEILERNHSDRN